MSIWKGIKIASLVQKYGFVLVNTPSKYVQNLNNIQWGLHNIQWILSIEDGDVQVIPSKGWWFLWCKIMWLWTTLSYCMAVGISNRLLVTGDTRRDAIIRTHQEILCLPYAEFSLCPALRQGWVSVLMCVLVCLSPHL